jgi:hypothetical protein
MVADIRGLDSRGQAQLMQLARRVWENEQPVDWRRQTRPSSELTKLDSFLLEMMGNPVQLEKIYADIVETCRARLGLAEDKRKRFKKKILQDVDSVAEAVAEGIRPFLEARGFPESFFSEKEESITFDFQRQKSLLLDCQPLMNDTALLIREEDSGRIFLDKVYPRAVAEIIVRALLMGRRNFTIPANTNMAEKVLSAFVHWFEEIDERIERGCQSSAVGTRYEDDLRAALLRKLKLHRDAGKQEVFGRFVI